MQGMEPLKYNANKNSLWSKEIVCTATWEVVDQSKHSIVQEDSGFYHWQELNINIPKEDFQMSFVPLIGIELR